MEKIVEREGVLCYRVQCACLSPEDAQDYTLEFEARRPSLTLKSRYVRHNWRNWWGRLLDAWTILTGREALMDGFVFREEDLRPMGELFLRAADEYEKWEREHRK